MDERLKRSILLAAFGMSSVAALSYQVLWGRYLTFTFGTTIYAISTILAAFMAGLALGSHVMARYTDRLKTPLLTFAVIELLIGVCGVLLLWVLPRLYLPFFALHRTFGDVFHIFNLSQFLLGLAVLLPPTFLMGATFPLSSKLYAQNPRTIGTDLGILYSVDTLGAIFGAFAGGFILIPVLGLENAVVATVFINYVLAATLFYLYRDHSLKSRLIFHTALIFALALSFMVLGRTERKTVAPFESLIWNKTTEREYLGAQEGVKLYEKDSAYGEVEVIRQGDVIDLYIDGILNTGINDPSYQLGFYPMLLHDNPKQVMNVGFGGGYAIQAQEKFGVDRIVCLEINPYVMEGAQFLREDTEYAIDDPRLELITGDGRNYLSSLNEHFDVIFCEVGTIWISGSSPLFTLEWLMIARDRLRKGGIYAQDLQLWEMSPEDLRIYLNTFRHVFPFVVIAEYNTEAVIMGSAEPLRFDREVIEQKISDPKIKAGLERARIGTVDDLLLHVVADTDRVEEITRGSLIMNTDDKPFLEFSTPRHIGSPEKNARDNLLMLKGVLK